MTLGISRDTTTAHSITLYWWYTNPDQGGDLATLTAFLNRQSVGTTQPFPLHINNAGPWGTSGSVGNLAQNTSYTLILRDQRTGDVARIGPIRAHALVEAGVLSAQPEQEDGSIQISTRSNSRRTYVSQRSSDQLSSVSDSASIDQRLFDLLVPEDTFVGHYVRQGTDGDWQRVDKLLLPAGKQIPDTAVSHIQSFFAPDHLDALTWLQPTGELVSFEYQPATGEHQEIPVTGEQGAAAVASPVTGISGAPALVQTDQELFHLLAPFFDSAKQNGYIVHLVHDSKTLQGPWKQVATLQLPPRSSAVSLALVQADGLGSLKAVVRVKPLEGPDELVSYQADPNFHWSGPFGLSVNSQLSIAARQGTISNVAGSPGLVQSIFGEQEQLDLLVPLTDPATGDIVLTQFTQPAGEGTSIEQPWTFAATLPPFNGDAHTQVVSASIIQDSARDLESIVHVITPGGQNLLAFYLFDPQTGWSSPAPVTTAGGQPIVVGQDNNPDEGGDDGDDGDDGDGNGDDDENDESE